jgi:hypothetical protein
MLGVPNICIQRIDTWNTKTQQLFGQGAPSCFLNDETGRLTSSHHLQLRARYPKNGGINGVAIPYLSQ